MTFSLPINFGRRACDRLLLRALSSADPDRSAILWMMVLVWMDFATAREDRRQIPAEVEKMEQSPTVVIIEEFIGWKGEPGRFVFEAIKAGFFTRVMVGDDIAELVLTDFFPANSGGTRISASEAGGVSKVYSNNRTRAELAAADQLRLFENSPVPELEGISHEHRKAALFLIHQLCLGLKRPFPQDETWKSVLVPKAVQVITTTTTHQRECLHKWFIKNRTDQRIPTRMDFILDKITDFVPEAVTAFSR